MMVQMLWPEGDFGVPIAGPPSDNLLRFCYYGIVETAMFQGAPAHVAHAMAARKVSEQYSKMDAAYIGAILLKGLPDNCYVYA